MSSNVLSCGGCGMDKWRIFDDGKVACAECNELGAGVHAGFAGFVPVRPGRYLYRTGEAYHWDVVKVFPVHGGELAFNLGMVRHEVSAVTGEWRELP